MTSSEQKNQINLHQKWTPFLEHLGSLFFYILLVSVFTWPLLNQLGFSIPGTESDAYVHLSVFNWFGRAVENGITTLYTDHLFFPVGVSLLNHNVAWFNIAVWFLLKLFVGQTSAYTLMILLSLAFNGYAIFLLAKDITQSQASSLLAGVVGTTWPFITTQLHHPNLIIIGFIPLAMRHMRRFILKKRKRDLIAVVVFIILTGSIRLQLLLMGLLMIGLYTLYLLLKSKQLTNKDMWQKLMLIGLLTAIGLSPFIVPIFQYQLARNNPGDLLASNLFFEFTDLAHYIQPSPYHPLWGDTIRQLESVPFHVPFLGYTVLALALLSLAKKKQQSTFWGIIAAIFMILALGPALEVSGHRLFTMPYIGLYEKVIIPVLRASNRFNILLPIPFGLLAAMGYQWLDAHFKKSWYRVGGWVLVVLLILFEFAMAPFPTLNLSVPNWYQTLATDTDYYGLVDIPMDLQHEEVYMLYQITHGKAMVEGNVARPPREAYRFIREVPLLHHLDRGNERLPPDKDINISGQLEMLAMADIRYVVLHRPFLTDAEIIVWREWFFMPPYYEDEQVVVYQTDTSQFDEQFVTDDAINGHVALATAKVSPDRMMQTGWVQVDAHWFVSDSLSEAENRICIALMDDEMNLMQTSCDYAVVDLTNEEDSHFGLLRRRYQLQVQPFLAAGSYQVVFYQSTDNDDLDLIYEGITAVSLHVDALPRTFEPPSPNVPMEVTYSDELALIGYDVEQMATAVDLTIYWQALKQPAHSYKIFVHLIDEASGTLVAQQDYIPQNWQYPTNFWESGEYVTDLVTLDLSSVPRGDYSLQVGIYRNDTGERLITTPTFPDSVVHLSTIHLP